MNSNLPQGIFSLVNRLHQSLDVPDAHLAESLQALQEHECWGLYFKLLESLVNNPKKRTLDHYVEIARSYSMYLEDIQQAAKICARLVKDFRLSYTDFREKVLYSVIVEQDYDLEATLLQVILPRLKTQEDNVACLERLCLIYEKKKFDELQLNKSYEKLFELDPTNIKALRYFKVVYTQTNQWEKVVLILKSLFHSGKHVNDKYRSAQELAAVYLYQLDQPFSAIETIEKFCLESPLNTFTIHFESYFKMQNWEGCLRVLKSHLRRVDEPLSKAIIYLKIGELEEQIKRMDNAEASYIQSSELAPMMLEPLENLVEMNLDTRRWDKVVFYISKIHDIIEDPFLKEKLREGRSRLQDALDQAKEKGMK